MEGQEASLTGRGQLLAGSGARAIIHHCFTSKVTGTWEALRETSA